MARRSHRVRVLLHLLSVRKQKIRCGVRVGILCITFSLIFINCNVIAETPGADWNQKMENFRSVLSALLPDLFSEKRFNAPENFKRIEENVKRLAGLAHEMPTGAFAQAKTELAADQDPSLTLISGLFKNEALLALTHLRSGHRAYARNVLKTIPNFCIACHTRSTGLDLSSVQEHVPKSLTPFERAQFFDATRQFDRALDEFEKILSNAPTVDRPLEWERAARDGIATAVRVKRDPQRALALVDRVLSSPVAPVFLKENALHWKTSLEEWKNEQPEKSSTADSLFSEGKKLVAQARNLQEYPSDRSADVLYLRASAVLHDFLSRFPDEARVGEVLLLTGMCYESLEDLQVWSMHDLYYEACVRKVPHTPVAHACYARYEQSIFFGFTGSGGTFLPPEVQTHLNQLKELAGPLATSKF